MLNDVETPEIEFPEKLHFLLTESCRYKVLYGGRGAGKTQNIARALVILCRQRKLRILCCREFQNSISESVYEVLKIQISALGWDAAFDVQAQRIVCKETGSEFIFKGLRYNIESIKSLAEIDIVWVEEANTVSKVTWDKLGPTIRGRHETDPRGNLGPFNNGPEIWISFNPELDTDETYKRFVLNPPNKLDSKGNLYSIVEKVNWNDNKWFPDDLREEMLQLKVKDENRWLEVWEGHTKVVLEGAVYAEEVRQCILDGRVGKVPYDPNRPVKTAWDFGHADKTAIWFVQTVGMEFNLIDYYEDNLKKMPFYINILQQKKYNYDMNFLPHDGEAETLSNVTPQRQLINAGYKTRIIQRPSRKFVGINAVRSIFPLCNFDETNTADGMQCVKRYCYKVNSETGTFSKEPDHDTPWSHGCFIGETEVLTFEGPKRIDTLPETGKVWTQFGWQTYFNPHITRKNASLVEVCFTDGFTTKCTPDHLFLTESGWKSAESLERGMSILSGSMKLLSSSKTEFTDFIWVSNILKLMVLYIDMFGQVLSVLFPKDAIYIIRMKINTITNWIIWNVFLGKNIYSLAGKYSTNEERLLNLPKKLEQKLLSGISLKKVESGIEKRPLIKNLELISQRQFSIVQFVKLHSKLLIEKNVGDNGVLLNADMFCLEKVGTSRNHGPIEIVKNAVRFFIVLKRLLTTNFFVQQNVGKLIIKNIKHVGFTSDVWCLTVPNCGHFALSNGAIVKNCDALQTLALSVKSEQASKKPVRTIGVGRSTPISTNNGWMG